jgi:hypothetical protein
LAWGNHFHLLLFCAAAATTVIQVKGAIRRVGWWAFNSPLAYVSCLSSKSSILQQDLACLSSSSRLVTSWQSVRPASGGHQCCSRRFRRRRHLPQVDLFPPHSWFLIGRPPKRRQQVKIYIYKTIIVFISIRLANVHNRKIPTKRYRYSVC